MKKYNVSVPRKYTKDGEEKTFWANVGKLIKFDATHEKPEGYILELNMFPDTKFGVFEDKPREKKETTPVVQKEATETEEEEYKGENIAPQDIPF